jgi:hypothetical protein
MAEGGVGGGNASCAAPWSNRGDLYSVGDARSCWVYPPLFDGINMQYGLYSNIFALVAVLLLKRLQLIRDRQWVPCQLAPHQGKVAPKKNSRADGVPGKGMSATAKKVARIESARFWVSIWCLETGLHMAVLTRSGGGVSETTRLISSDLHMSILLCLSWTSFFGACCLFLERYVLLAQHCASFFSEGEVLDKNKTAYIAVCMCVCFSWIPFLAALSLGVREEVSQTRSRPSI